jgi:predicted translin family RNA/ssDNA-binding protein
MSLPSTPQPDEAVQNVAEAHKLLKSLQAELAQHPELDAAIRKLELALSALTLQTGGLL